MTLFASPPHSVTIGFVVYLLSIHSAS